jgi:hypothetical protein
VALRRLAVALWLAACAPAGEDGGTIDVTATLDRAAADFGAIRVTGLSAGERSRAVTDTRLLAVFAAQDSVPPGSPALSGTWRQSGDTMVFSPRFPPSSGVLLWVRVRQGRDSDSTVHWWRFELPARAADSAPPRLLAVHPATDTLPENLLRWYLEFSQPMRPGQALGHVRLLNDRGEEDRTAFLDTSEELWDPDGRRLTLLFDPGRVKRGIRTNLEQGRPLEAGRTYRLVIDAGWEDMSGQPLAAPFEKRVVATPADHIGPDPAAWALLLPIVGTTDPLVVSFGEALDHALAARLIIVLDERGHSVGGRVALRAGDREWTFTPDHPWTGGKHQLQVSRELEDVAGNRPGRAFDHEAGATPAGASPSGPIVRWFEPRSGGA